MLSRGARLLVILLLLPAAAVRADHTAAFPEGAELSPLEPAGEVERYHPDNLWEKIDGEAELYRSFGFTAASYRRYALPVGEDEGLEIALFELPGSLEAYGLFALFLPAGAELEAIGNGAYVSEFQGLLWHGSRFGLVDSFLPPGEGDASIRKAIDRTATRLGTPPAPPAVLTEMARITGAGRLNYQPQHLLGRELFPPGLESGTDPLVFLATEPVQGKRLFAAYEKILEAPQRAIAGDTIYLSGRDPLLGEVTLVFREGRLAGARSSSPDEISREILLRLLAIP